jgi:hypothetical protein
LKQINKGISSGPGIFSIGFSFRGTFSLADAISDIVCDEEPFLEGFAHRGILNGARKILKVIWKNKSRMST